MSRLDGLVQDLCPAGVPHTSLGELCSVLNGYPFKSESFNTDGVGLPLIRVRDVNAGFSGTFYEGDYPERYLVSDGDLLIGMDGDFRAVRWTHGPALLNQRVCRLQDFSSKVNPSFIFYTMQETLDRIHQTTEKSTVKHLSSRELSKAKVPVPPLAVQDEIVRILDTFSGLTAELEAELEARRTQYAHYRDVLVSDVGPSADVQALGEVFQMRAGNHIKAAEISEVPTDDKPYPCYGGNGLRGYVSDYNYDQDVLLIGRQGALCGNVHRAEGRIYATEHAVVVTPSQAVDMSWAFHKLTHMNLNQYKSKSAQPGLAVGKIKNLLAPGVPVSKQRHVGKVLDQFEELTSDLASGLPAEIQARRMQYEYYRDRLLAFDEVLA